MSKRLLTVLGGSDYLVTYDFTVDVGDTFNRTNASVLGDTDGGLIDGVSGGSGITWIDQVGTWRIVSNRASASAVVSLTAIATVETNKVDGVICASIVNAGSFGITARYVDANNYIKCYIASNTVNIVEIVESSTKVLMNKAATYVEGAELVIRMDGLRLSLEYNGVYYGFVTVNAAFATSTLHGLWTNGAASTWSADSWHFISLPAYQSTQRPSIVKVIEGEYLVTHAVRGDATRCVEYELYQEKAVLAGYAFTSNVRHIMGQNLVTIATGAKTVLSNGVGWESAGLIGAEADAQGDYGYFGSVHQSEQLVSIGFTLRKHVTILRWKRYYLSNIQITQNINTVYPKDKATIIGTTILTHSFGTDLLTVSKSYTYETGYKIYGQYGAMYPILNPSMDTYKVGDNDAALMVLDGNAKNLNTETAILKAWLSTGDFTVNLFLPTGYPSSENNWTKSGGYKAWFKDNADGNVKFYVNFVSTNFTDVVAAVNSSHIFQYFVDNGIPA